MTSEFDEAPALGDATPGRGGLSPDRPLHEPDDDRLGYAEFAKALAAAIKSLESPDGIVVGIYGEWGLGKTTALNFIERYLSPGTGEQSEVELVVLRFNPWLFTGRVDLAAAYLRELQRLFQRRKLATKQARKALSSLLTLAGAVPVPGAGAGEVLAKMVDPRTPSIQELKDEVTRALSDQAKRLVVVIDDIDRLTAEEIKELFSVIKSIADFPNTIYLLAFDKDVVSKAVGPDEAAGLAYIEKIVQVPFELPRPERATLQDLFLEQVGSVVGEVHEDLIDVQEWGTAVRRCVMPIVDTPRDVVRLTNSLKVTYAAVRGQVNVVDFVLIETARVFLPPLYDSVRSNPEMFGVVRDLMRAAGLTYAEDEKKAFHQSWIERLQEGQAEAAKNLAVTLFPSLSETLDTVRLSSRRQDGVAERRLTQPEHFDLYFRLALGEEVLSREVVMNMVALAAKPKEFSKALLDLREERIVSGRTQASVMLDELIGQARSGFQLDDIADVVLEVVSVGDQLWLDSDEGPLMAGNDLRLFWLVEALVGRLPKDERAPLLARAIENAESVATPVRIVQCFADRLGVDKGSVAPQESRTL